MLIVTHFNKKKLNISIKHLHYVWGCLLLVCLSISAVAATPEDVFNDNKERIVQSKISVINDFVFSVGRVESQSLTQEISFSKAKLIAYGNLPIYVVNKIKWPVAFQSSLRQKIFEEYLKTKPTKLFIEGATTVFSNRSGNNYMIVIAVLKQNIAMEIPDYEQIYTELANKINIKNKAIKPSVIMEIAPESTLKYLLDELSLRISTDYGTSSGDVTADIFASNFILDTSNKINQLVTLDHLLLTDLYSLLNEVPYHPMVCFAIGEKLSSSDMPINAQLLWSRGTVAPELSPKFAELCNKKLKSPIIFPNKPLIKLNLTPFKVFLGKAKYDEVSLNILNQAGGRIPAGNKNTPIDENYKSGMQDYNNNNLISAYSNFCKSVAKNLSFDACNMAGNAARRINKPYEGIPLLLQAVAIDDNKANPWINLAFAFKVLKTPDMVRYCVSNAEKRVLDDWGKKQIAILHKYLEQPNE